MFIYLPVILKGLKVTDQVTATLYIKHCSLITVYIVKFPTISHFKTTKLYIQEKSLLFSTFICFCNESVN